MYLTAVPCTSVPLYICLSQSILIPGLPVLVLCHRVSFVAFSFLRWGQQWLCYALYIYLLAHRNQTLPASYLLHLPTRYTLSPSIPPYWMLVNSLVGASA